MYTPNPINSQSNQTATNRVLTSIPYTYYHFFIIIIYIYIKVYFWRRYLSPIFNIIHICICHQLHLFRHSCLLGPHSFSKMKLIKYFSFLFVCFIKNTFLFHLFKYCISQMILISEWKQL